MKKIGVIGIPGKWSTETLADAIEKQTGFRLVIDMSKVSLDLSSNTLNYLEAGRKINLCDLDGLIIKKISAEYNPNTLDRLELLLIAQSQGVKIFSSPEKIMRLIDRLSCTVILRKAGLPMPDTVVTEDINEAIATVKNFSSAVFKPLFSTKARGMIIIDADSPDTQIKKEIEQFQSEHQMMYIQKKINLPGQDLGLVFLGGQYLGTYARVNQSGTWNTTINSGGRYAQFSPSEEIISIAQQAQDLFSMDFTTVDIAETDEGPIVFEVSAFGGFQGALDGIGIKAAQLYAEYVLNKI
ncbi:MAG: GAK system ATP-grasp enzyme [gamma proteobacterium symbiont of Bathyaustriella thionipta]|nr:GAK system ATP-grasp enzyme [gamma proteobacterium symbiont of Bathyaustriella thionipta]MCU7950465.1 GAK system ATP-grasp enzyme [gamma proteobacterium symbiont of Bathyaustriella thionipta]MCU7953273.1 GAK system ATP-grasp enzyme [gamma proteobacterium symbiont of Bathyaustriella thionipta]MCU7957255.1 GAK system ATP-grasp enzyme [gamma proteobacterium symbiont of Bathyaustriella thionipta]MCU7966525.1 GAK system ATP-grasp enzyme [gamma proteobacterium symbiont of Bathyaustriella thionipta